MSGWRKVNAILKLSLVSAVLWGIIVTAGFFAYALFAHGLDFNGSILAGFLNLMIHAFPLGAVIGGIGGAVYATTIALVPIRQSSPGLSAIRAATLGAVGGVAAVWIFTIVATRSFPTVHVGSISASFALAGAATGIAILGAARRGKLPSAPEVPEVLAP